MYRLAIVYQTLKKYDLAKSLYEECLEHRSKISEKKHSNSFLLPQRSRCLLPTNEPPSPAKFWKHQKKLDEKAARVANSSNPSTVTATSIPSQLSTGTAGLHPSTQSSDPNELLLGAAADATDKMSRLVILSMELHCKTRKELLPNPKYDGIEMIVWIADDIISNAENEHRSKTAGILLVLTPNYRHQQPQNNNNNNNNNKNRQQPSTNTEPNSTSTSSTLPNLDKEKENLYKEIKMNIHCISSISSFENTEIQIFSTELEMIQYFCYLSREIIDPDFLIGYESSNNSYGYLIKRGKIIGLDILQLLSRIPTDKPSFRNALVRAEMKENHPELFENEEADDFHDLNSIQADVGIFIKGRTFLNTWHLLKSELKLWNNTIQYAVEHILQKTLPYFTPAQLTKWYQLSHTRYKTISYVYLLTLCNLLLIEKLDIIRKISECARLYGIDFFSVFHRGSQYRVEAALIVKAHAHDYLLLSPSKMKVANQAAMEVIPLVLEPRSHFYTDPVLVLDYQSLYPSMMLAYNLCYSTCMGKLKTGTISNPSATGGGGGGGSMPNMFPQDIPAETTGRLGVISYPESISAVNSTLHLKNLEKFFQERGGPGKNPSENKPKIDEHTPYVSPNGVVFCAKSVRQGILPMMIREMLDTRLMVKRSMKKHAKISTDGKKHNKVLEKVLDARQLAIKLLANVTCKLSPPFFLLFFSFLFGFIAFC
jgi:DNA polymerase elongation subunit (family B)